MSDVENEKINSDPEAEAHAEAESNPPQLSEGDYHIKPLPGQLNEPAGGVNQDPHAGNAYTGEPLALGEKQDEPEVDQAAYGDLGPDDPIPDQHLPQSEDSPPATTIYDLHQGQKRFKETNDGVARHRDGRPAYIHWRGRAKPVGSAE